MPRRDEGACFYEIGHDPVLRARQGFDVHAEDAVASEDDDGEDAVLVYTVRFVDGSEETRRVELDSRSGVLLAHLTASGPR